MDPDWGTLDLGNHPLDDYLALLPNEIEPEDIPVLPAFKRQRTDTTTPAPEVSVLRRARDKLSPSHKASSYAILAADPIVSLADFALQLSHRCPGISTEAIEDFYSQAFERTHLVLTLHVALLSSVATVSGSPDEILSRLRAGSRGRTGLPLSSRRVEEWFQFCIEPMMTRSPSAPFPCTVDAVAFAVPVMVLSDLQKQRLFAAASAQYSPASVPVVTEALPRHHRDTARYLEPAATATPTTVVPSTSAPTATTVAPTRSPARVVRSSVLECVQSQITPPAPQIADYSAVGNLTIVGLSLLVEKPNMIAGEFTARLRKVDPSAHVSDIQTCYRELTGAASVAGPMHMVVLEMWDSWDTPARVRATTRRYSSRGFTGTHRDIHDWIHYCVAPLKRFWGSHIQPPCVAVARADGTIVYTLSTRQRKQMFADRLAIEKALRL